MALVPGTGNDIRSRVVRVSRCPVAKTTVVLRLRPDPDTPRAEQATRRAELWDPSVEHAETRCRKEKLLRFLSDTDTAGMQDRLVVSLPRIYCEFVPIRRRIVGEFLRKRKTTNPVLVSCSASIAGPDCLATNMSVLGLEVRVVVKFCVDCLRRMTCPPHPDKCFLLSCGGETSGSLA